MASLETYTVDLRDPLPAEPEDASKRGRFLGILPRHQRTLGFPVRDHQGMVVLVLKPGVRRARFGYALNSPDGTELAVLDLGVVPGLITGLVSGSFKPAAGAGGQLDRDPSYLPSREREEGGAPYRFVVADAAFIVSNGPVADTWTMVAEDGGLVADGSVRRFDSGYQLDSVTIQEHQRVLPLHLLVGACWWRAQCRLPVRPPH